MMSSFIDILEESEITFYVVLLIVVCVPIVYFWRNVIVNLVWKALPRPQENAPKRNKMKYTACKSPDCVRCVKYDVIRSQAYQQMSTYAEIAGGSGLGRLLRAVYETNPHPVTPECSDGDCDCVNCDEKQKHQMPNVLHVRTLHAMPWWHLKSISSTNIYHLASDVELLLERNFEIILQEFQIAEDTTETNFAENDFPKVRTANRAVMARPSGWVTNRTASGSWSVFYFYNQGKRNDENCKQCPKTTRIIDSLSSFMKGCMFGNACFSVIHPKTVIDEHYGPCNIRIRCHLGLRIPKDCTLTVAGESHAWTEGKCLLFDDSFLHRASHRGSQSQGPRTVLMVDFWHPELTAKEKAALCYTFASET